MPTRSTPARRSRSIVSTTYPYDSSLSALMKIVLSVRSFMSSRRRGSSVARGSARSLRKRSLSLVSVMTSRCSSSAALAAPTFGRLTSIPRYIIGAVSMKMRSSTSTTSTSGMMLISASVPRTRPVASAPASALIAILERLRRPHQPALDQVRHLEPEVLHLGGPVPDLADEVVVADDGGNRGDQAEEGGDQGLGDPRRHHRQARRSLAADLVERAED